MENVLEFIFNNPVGNAMLAVPFLTVAFFAGYKLLLKMLLSEKNIKLIADNIDKVVDEVQKKDKASGKETRSALIKLAERIIKDLKESDGVN